MHAIIQTGGKQYRVKPGDVIRVERLAFDKGAAIEFPAVLAVFRDNGEVLTESELPEAKVVATVTQQDRAKKIIVFKFKRKKQYKKTIGHRQNFTELRINEIVA
ncbi:MAG: 50S ribosomal protein L21 [Acidobacteria bacterium]|nr:50S ribosomal protein L21 [Acidobacteriota bacterium]MBI3470025.1 50S ribosomal protein L21 [Candidatus Solibacter usitatus]